MATDLGHQVLGIDIGMTAVKMALVDGDGKLVAGVYRRHHGSPLQVVREEAGKLALDGGVRVIATGTNVDALHRQTGVPVMDSVRSEIAAVKTAIPGARNIMNVGGSTVSLISLSEAGNFQGYSTNSLCAAGTGSFLDEQAGRLEIACGESSSCSREKEIPQVATRCAVFAKSDIIHRQQEGYSRPALWSALCKGMTETMLQTLLKGRPLDGLTVLTGGVSLNAEAVFWLKTQYGETVQTFPQAHLSGALGAAILADGMGMPHRRIRWDALTDEEGGKEKDEIRKPLVLEKSKYPEVAVQEDGVDAYGTEIRISIRPTGTTEVYLGIDVGSTSTKMAVVDGEGRVLIDLYRKTAGDPIGATQKLFVALDAVRGACGASWVVKGVGTTGSGRKLAGAVVGADEIVNEISAHVAGALRTDSTIDTIFEIGGQDSKYMRMKDGRIHDANMNFVCAAGTGSFVEEQARKLGIPLREVGDAVLGIRPPRTSDRCTVFMEQDIHRLLKKGYSKQECMAAVMYSIIQNYLNKVVGRRPVSKEKIFFQGATARNKGLVAAIENLLDVEVVVSPFCHVMGAFGVALLTQRAMEKAGRRTTFKGLDLGGRSVSVRHEECDFCRDRCKISYASIEGEKEEPSWGYRCGRESDAREKKVSRHFAPFKKREKLWSVTGGTGKVPPEAKVVGLPRALTTHTFFPLWSHFFRRLGLRVVLSPPTSPEIISDGVKRAAAEFCFPVKLSLGHVCALAMRDRMDFIFLPAMISHERNPNASNSYFCPYVQGFASVAKQALSLGGDAGISWRFRPSSPERSGGGSDVEKILSPVVDLSLERDDQVSLLTAGLGKKLGRSRRDIGEAWESAWRAQAEFHNGCQTEGKRILDELAKNDQIGVVVLGRPYNTADLGANLALPRKLADAGYTVVPIDMIPWRQESMLRPDDPSTHRPRSEAEGAMEPYSNVFWSYGQKILNAVRHVRRTPNLFAVYFTNFNCGPDSFLLNFAEHEMGDKPMLVLEVDEHGADAGYTTRIEAFLDVIRSWRPRERERRIHFPKDDAAEFKRRTIWIPPMHPVTGRLFAAAFRGHGYRCEALTVETREDLALGRSLARGSECLPMAATIGSFVNQMRRIGADAREHALFMPTADGPCRFGQYALLQRMILNRVGYKDIPILSPSSRNTYQGVEEDLRRYLFKGVCVSDTLTKCACRVRPYESIAGRTDEVLEQGIRRMESVFEHRGDPVNALTEAVGAFLAVPVASHNGKPLVGVVGEIYVRCNPFCNEDVIRTIERFGGEAWLSPIAEWILYTSEMEKREGGWRRRSLGARAISAMRNHFMLRVEHNLSKPAHGVLRDRREPAMEEILDEGSRYLPLNFVGEAVLTLGRAALFVRQGAKLVVNCAPFSCMPGAITAALFQRMEKQTGIPMVSFFYDGEGGLNERLKFFMHNL
ncbi:MAG: hypothetical protein HYT87_14255 [Nitrospirae bacterium]|nr:hypothetical protein [Nitrospirota bacterium]